MPQDLLSQFDRKYALPIETYRQVANLSLRNAIPNGIRWEGMMCYVVSEGKSYVLTGGLTDSDWVEFGTLVNVTVVDNLASTSATDALSANQGRVLEQSKLSDAPSDGSTYGRKDGAWEVVSGGGAVDSVFGRTGAVVAANGDYTFAQIGSTPTTLSGYGITDAVPTSRTLTAGNGLTGGGDLSANRTFTLGTPGSTTLSSTNAVTASSHTHAFAPGGTTAQYIRGDGSLATYAGGVTSVFGRTGAVVAANGDYTFAQIGSTPTTLSGYGITDGVPTSRTLTAGTGLTGGGDLTANRSFALDLTYTDGRYVNTTGDTMTGALTAPFVVANGDANAIRILGTGTGASNTGYLSIYESNGSTRQGRFGFVSTGTTDLLIQNDLSSQRLELAGGGGDNGLKFFDGSGTQTVWHSGNDGSGSGLDADLLDGVQGGSFLRSDETDTKTAGNTIYNDNLQLSFGNSGDMRLFHDGAQNIIMLNNGNFRIRDGATDRFIFERTTGNLTATGTMTATNFILSSDRRLKKNIKNYDPKPLNLKYRTWEWKKDGSTGKGFIAQEVQKTNPEYVVEGNDGMLAVDYIGILIAKVAELESDIAKIKKQI